MCTLPYPPQNTIENVQKDVGKRLGDIVMKGRVPDSGEVFTKEDSLSLKRAVLSAQVRELTLRLGGIQASVVEMQYTLRLGAHVSLVRKHTDTESSGIVSVQKMPNHLASNGDLGTENEGEREGRAPMALDHLLVCLVSSARCFRIAPCVLAPHPKPPRCGRESPELILHDT